MRSPARQLFRPLWAWLCLLAYVASATPLPPLVTALVAWMDSDHRVTLTADSDGTRVVLAHDAGTGRRAITHTHCAVSRLLTLLAEPAGPAPSDHILAFHSGGLAVLREKAMPNPAMDDRERPAAPGVFILPEGRNLASASTRHLERREHSPPPPRSFILLRPLVLLI